MVGRVGVEPTSPVFQTGAVTTLATAPQWSQIFGAGNGVRTRGLLLGKEALYH